ncbi:MAG: DUF6476 family protein [Pseudomonadota bacterium]
MADTSDDTSDQALPRDLRFLKTLVTVLTAVMILGVIAIVALLVIRLNATPRPILVHPERFDLPSGAATLSYSLADDAVVIVTDDGVIRVFDIESGDLVQEMPVRAAPGQ